MIDKNNAMYLLTLDKNTKIGTVIQPTQATLLKKVGFNETM